MFIQELYVFTILGMELIAAGLVAVAGIADGAAITNPKKRRKFSISCIPGRSGDARTKTSNTMGTSCVDGGPTPKIATSGMSGETGGKRTLTSSTSMSGMADLAHVPGLAGVAGLAGTAGVTGAAPSVSQACVDGATGGADVFDVASESGDASGGADGGAPGYFCTKCGQTFEARQEFDTHSETCLGTYFINIIIRAYRNKIVIS